MVEAMVKIAEIKKDHPKDLELPTFDAMRCAMSEHEVLQTEEDKLFELLPDSDGISRLDSSCFHCRKKLYLETDPDDEEGYLISDEED